VAMIRLVAFDLDDTLAESKCEISDEMASALNSLLQTHSVCVITGGNENQIMQQVVSKIEPENYTRLHLMPTCGTTYIRLINGQWTKLYSKKLSDDESRRAIRTLEGAAKSLGLWEENPYGNIIENRESQITFSALGQKAPVELKKAWDPTGKKKNLMRNYVAQLLPDLEVRSGGSTSIDITMKGIDKSYGILTLIYLTRLTSKEVLFVGDRLDENGNDYPVISTGVECVATKGPKDTLRIIDDILQAV
jgi:HAD superfamily hydrolase (TIGR01484 family)